MRGDTGGASGIDFNYGAAPDLQLTATVPAGDFDKPAGSATSFGLGDVELAAKYRFLHQDSFGLVGVADGRPPAEAAASSASGLRRTIA